MYEPIPRTIWMLWLQGWERAPWIVRQCLVSWERRNPSWRIVLLDEANFADYIDWPFGAMPITPQAKSDLIRVRLLQQYGGVWSDAACFCNSPLDDWLDEWAPSGFFAPQGFGPERLIENWFLAAARGSHLTQRRCSDLWSYWSRYRFRPDPAPWQRFARWLVGRFCDRRLWTTRYWSHPLVARLFGVYPYLWAVYRLPLLLERDGRCAEEFAAMHKLPGWYPERVKMAGYEAPITDELRGYIDRRETPVFKLDWRIDPQGCREGCALHYLLSSL